MFTGYTHDRRRFQRLKVNLSVFFRLIEAPLRICKAVGIAEREAITLDISQGGISFLCDCYISENAILYVKFILFKCDDEGLISFNDPVEIRGKVCSCVPFGLNQYRVGVCFQNMDVEKELLISDFIASTLKPAVLC